LLLILLKYSYIYNSLDVSCTGDEDCPSHTTCGSDPHNRERHCRYRGCSGHYISQFYCKKKDKSVCTFDYNEKEGKNLLSIYRHREMSLV